MVGLSCDYDHVYHSKCLTSYIHMGNTDCIICNRPIVIKSPEPEELILGDGEDADNTVLIDHNVEIDRVDEMALETEASDTNSVHR